MQSGSIDRIRAAVRDVPDFPKPGILFKDITPILADGELLRLTVEAFAASCEGLKLDKIAGIDARGFIFGGALAFHLGIGFIPIRKKGKLPFRTASQSYALEYGTAEVEIHSDAIEPGESVLLLDDLLATGGTAEAAAALITLCGGKISGIRFLIELAFLSGREKLASHPVQSLLTY